jgi:hypothetical protein
MADSAVFVSIIANFWPENRDMYIIVVTLNMKIFPSSIELKPHGTEGKKIKQLCIFSCVHGESIVG